MPAEAQFVHYLPLATTGLSAVFLLILLRRFLLTKSGPHLLWWAAGIFCYGLGTALESTITLSGNTIMLNKAWYIAGALLGGYPLAQGTVYLLLTRRTAHLLSACTVPLIIVLSVLVILSPVRNEMLDSVRPSGNILGWQTIRLFTPLINGYAAIFLIGGAILSAVRYWKQAYPLQAPNDSSDSDSSQPVMETVRSTAANRAVGNTLIAIGALLPGIGGGMAKAGVVEALYIGELIGLMFIWSGYAACVWCPKPFVFPEISSAEVVDSAFSTH